MPGADDIAARLSMLQGGGNGKSWFEKPVNPGGASLTATTCGIGTGNIGGPFGLRPKQGGMSAQLQFEAQRLAQMRNEADAALAQACAAAGPMPPAMQQVSFGGGSFIGNGVGGGGGDFGIA